jgi:hypothetical protein
VYMEEATYFGRQGEAGLASAWLNPALLSRTMALVLPSPLPNGHIQVGTLGLPGRDLPTREKVCSCPPG